MASVPVAAAAVWAAVSGLRRLLPPDVKWFIAKGGRDRIALYDERPLERSLAASGPRRASEAVLGVPAHELGVVATRKGADVAVLALGFTVEAGARAPGATIELSVHELLFAGVSDTPALAEELIRVLVEAFDLDAARSVPGSVHDEPRLLHRVRVGWLTFLPRGLAPLPALPPLCACTDIGARGWILRALPLVPEDRSQEYLDALAHVRHALGARVLLDGPSYPPRGHEETPQAAAAELAVSPAAELPSYMKGSPAERPDAPRPVVVMHPEPTAPPGPALAAMSTATAAIDISKIAAASVPFGAPASGPPSAAKDPPSVLPPAEATVARSGETVDVDVGAIARRVLAFGPPGEKKTVATAALSVQPAAPPVTASAAGLPAAPPGKRWRRFDPQTGRPLPEPVLEDIPAAPTSAQEKPPGYHAETAELDPALVAAALRKGPSPFRR